MPYQVYIPWLREKFFSKIENPTILEIGADRGQMLIPIMQNFTFANIAVDYTALDIRRDETLVEMLAHFLKTSNQRFKYEIENSLTWLPKCNKQFDIILIDGDHNYKTVSQELSNLPRLLRPAGVAICDDYQNSKWSEKDLYYSTRESHKDIEIATPPEETEKQGVRAAVDDFIKNNPGWGLATPVEISEAVVIRRK